MSTARRYAAWLLCLCFLPSDALPQRPAVEALRALPLDSLSGSVAVYYSPGHADRARELQTSYGAAVAHYQDSRR
jgi:hypothetical protein